MKNTKRLYIEDSKITNKILNILILDIDKDIVIHNKNKFTIKKIETYYKNIIKDSIPIPDKYYELFSKINLIHFCCLNRQEFLQACLLEEWTL
jgi:hypothetical protein